MRPPRKDVRNPTIDAIKGFLICLVFAGHLFVEPVTENPWKWIIYGFHMPLFLGLGALLLNFERLRTISLGELCTRYFHRMLLPWVIACVVYTSVVLYQEGLTLKHVVSHIVVPWYHLWYIPVFFVYIVITAVLPLSRWQLFAGSFVFSLMAMILLGINANEGILPHKVQVLLGVPALYLYLVFFFAGGVAGSPEIRMLLTRYRFLVWVAPAVLLPLWSAFFYWRMPVVMVPVFLIMNFLMIFSLPIFIESWTVEIPIINRIGRNSLFYYLWHPALIFLMKACFYPHVSASVAVLVTTAVSLATLTFFDHWLTSKPLVAKLVGLMPAEAGAS
jgi:acyltransferase